MQIRKVGEDSRSRSALRRREQRPKVTQAELGRIATFLRAMGAKVAAVNVMPGHTKIVTTDGQGVAIDDDRDDLDLELQEYRQRSGKDPA